MTDATHIFGTALRRPAFVTAVALVVGFAAIAGAWAFEYAGLAPCPLCLEQRWPYYLGLPLAALALVLFLAAPPLAALGRVLIALTALLFLAGGLLGIYHAGVEWALWPGPSDCVAAGAGSGAAGSLIDQMRQTRIVPCDEAAWRLFGLSLAGYNAIVSLFIAGLIGWALAGRPPAQGSSSLSQ